MGFRVWQGLFPGVFKPENQVDFALSPGTSSHALGLTEAFHLAKVMDQRPKRLFIVGIHSHNFAAGTELSQELLQRLPTIETEILKLKEELNPTNEENTHA